MKILYVYPHDNRQVAQYVSLLTKSLPEGVETAVSCSPRETAQMVAHFAPDIIHLNADAECKDFGDNTRFVITPHGHKVGRKAYAVVARSEMERKRLETDAANSHNTGRTVVVRNPLVTKTTNTDRFVREMMAVYTKVMDSNVLPLMDDSTLRTFRQLLKVGIAGDKRWVEGAISSEVDWRKIAIYSHYEGVTDIVERGLQLAGMTNCASLHDNKFSIGEHGAYLPEHYSTPCISDRASLTDIIKKAREETENRKLSMSRLAEIHEHLMQSDVDEDKLCIELQNAGLSEYFASLLQVLSEETLLDEGFMPMTPKENTETQRIRTNLQKHLQI